jgi:predicted RNA-binding protein Jag
MERDSKAIKKNAQRLAWYMRGSISYTDILNMSPDELKFIHDIIDENLETTKKSQMPFF